MKRTFLIAALVAGLAGFGCSNKHKRGVDLGKEIIKASNAEAQLLFDEGLAALQGERWDEAAEKFRMVQGQYPADPIAPVAELYAARSGLQRLAVLAKTDHKPGSASLAALASLSDSREDERIKWAAAVYYAAGLSALGEHGEATQILKDYPSTQLSPLVLPADQTAAALLVAEGLLGAGRYADSLAAYSALWSSTEDDELQRFATSRALESAGRLSESDLAEWTGSDVAFPRAISGLVLLERRAEKASPEEADALQALQSRIAADVAEIGEGSRLEAVSFHLAANLPPQRLAIALVVPLTGPAASAGRAALDGALVAADAYDTGLASTTVVLVDSNQAEPNAQMARLRKLGVSAVIGPLDNKKAAAWGAAANEAELPLVMLTTDAIGEAAGDWVFRWFIDASAEARGVARVATAEQGDKKIAVLRPNIGYGRQMGEWFTAAVGAAGAEIVLDVEYDRGKTDYSSLARKVATARPDAIFIPDTAAKVGEVTAFLAQANVWGIDGMRRADPKSKRHQVHYLGTSLWNDASLLRQARSYVAGALIPAWSASAFEEPASREFFAQYQQSTGKQPSDLAAFAADAVGFVRARFASGESTPLQVRDAALRKELYRGITGPARFRPDGETVRTLRFITVKDGVFEPSPRRVNIGVDGS